MSVYKAVGDAFDTLNDQMTKERDRKRYHQEKMQQLELRDAQFQAEMPMMKQKIEEAQYWNTKGHFGLENAYPQILTPDKAVHLHAQAKDGRNTWDEAQSAFLLGTPDGTYIGEDFKPYNADGTPFEMSRSEYARRFGGAASIIAARTNPVKAAHTRVNDLENNMADLSAQIEDAGGIDATGGIIGSSQLGGASPVPKKSVLASLSSQYSQLELERDAVIQNLDNSEWREEQYLKKAQVFDNLIGQANAIGVKPQILNQWLTARDKAMARADFERKNSESKSGRRVKMDLYDEKTGEYVKSVFPLVEEGEYTPPDGMTTSVAKADATNKRIIENQRRDDDRAIFGKISTLRKEAAILREAAKAGNWLAKLQETNPKAYEKAIKKNPALAAMMDTDSEARLEEIRNEILLLEGEVSEQGKKKYEKIFKKKVEAEGLGDTKDRSSTEKADPVEQLAIEMDEKIKKDTGRPTLDDVIVEVSKAVKNPVEGTMVNDSETGFRLIFKDGKWQEYIEGLEQKENVFQGAGA